MPNHYIQGGCGDVCKIAMNCIEAEGFKDVDMLIQIHDEILFEVEEGAEEAMHEIKTIMEEAYPFRKLPLTVGIDYSLTDWHNKEVYND